MQDLVDHVGRYREEAFHFVREGLSHTAQQVHGPESEAHQVIQKFLMANDLEWHELVDRYHQSELPEAIVKMIDTVGGCDKLDRHISGQQLCWGLRDFALKRWGMLARPVLESWNVKTTNDFGRIVFGFIECDMMQQQPGDSEDDFDSVYAFDDAFDDTNGPDVGSDSSGGDSAVEES